MNRDKSRRPRKGAVLQIVLGIVTAGAVAWAGVSSVWPSGAGQRVAARFRTPPNHIEVEAALGELGLTPKVLACAGLSVQQTSLFASAAATNLREGFTNLRLAQESAYQARREVDRLERLIRTGQGSQEDVTSLATATANLNSARAQAQSILAQALTEGGEEIPSQVLAKLNLFRGNKVIWDIPERYLGDERSEAQWVELREALANETIAIRRNEQPDAAAQQILQGARATVNSVAAATNLENLVEITASWNAAMGQ